MNKLFPIPNSQFPIPNSQIIDIYFNSRLFFLTDNSTVPKRIPIISLIIALGLWSGLAKPLFAQALVPYRVDLNSEQLKQTGLSLVEEAIQLARFQQFEMAVARAKLAAELAPNESQTWALLGGLYLQEQKWDEAIAALETAVKLDSSRPELRFILGRAHFQKQEYKEAIKQIRAGLKIEPNSPGALFDLGNAYYKQGELKKAIAEYEEAFELEEKLWPAVNNIGLVRYEMGDVQAAMEKWREAIAIDDGAAEAMLALAVALYQNGETEEGLAMGEKALRLDPRYGDIDYLVENLWGDRLLSDARKFLANPKIEQTLAEVEDALPAFPGFP